MKKILALVLALALVVCASLALAEEEKVLTHEEYVNAELESQVDQIMGEPGIFTFPEPPVPVAGIAPKAQPPKKPAPPKPAAADKPAEGTTPAPKDDK